MSHIRDHHALHAAQGVSHIWSASIITGFAIVLTGAVVFQTAQARTAQTAATGARALQSENAQLIQRLNRLEALMLDTRRACGGGEEAPAAAPRTEAERELLRNDRPTTTRDQVPGYVPAPAKK